MIQASVAERAESMSKQVGRIARATAVHEAGHAIAMCRYEHGFEEIHARARPGIIELPNSRRGNSGTKVYGIVEPRCHMFGNSLIFGASIEDAMFGNRRNELFEHGVRYMLSTAAGPAAQSKQAHKSNLIMWNLRLFCLGRNEELIRKLKLPPRETLDDLLPRCDELDYLKSLYFLAPEDKEKRERIHSAVTREVTHFLRDKRMWSAINQLAGLLQARRDLDCYEDGEVKAIADSIPRMDWPELLSRMGQIEIADAAA